MKSTKDREVWYTPRELWCASGIVTKRGNVIGFRYEPEQVRLTWLQTIRRWLNGLKNLEWNWSRNTLVMRPIKPGEPGYDEAPYEMCISYQNPKVKKEGRGNTTQPSTEASNNQ
jgi:hypothetical protein